MRPEITGRKTATLPQSLEEHRILSARQAAELLGVSLATFRRLHWAGKLPPAIQLSERRLGWPVRGLLEHHLEKRGEVAA
jgi:predicted DNA-binding transcriptional regulator AlpA